MSRARTSSTDSIRCTRSCGLSSGKHERKNWKKFDAAPNRAAAERKEEHMDKHPIRFGVQTGQQNIEWEQLRSFWAKADGWGYDSLWVFDHFYPIFSPDPAGPCFEGWTLLSALSQNTKSARHGSLVNV